MKKLTAVILTVMMLLSANVGFSKEYAQKFWDVPKTYWGFEYIADLTERGVIKGYEDGSFKPEATVSRSEWAKMMVDAAGLQTNDNKVYYTDTANHWANKYINAASSYLLAYTDGSYRPDQAATREDVTVAMVKLKGYDTSDVDYSYLNFRDNDSISNYAKGYVAVAIKNNLITGFEDNTFRGQDTLTRAEAATLMYRAFKLGNNDKVTETNSKTEIKTDDSRKSDSDYAKQAEPNYTEPEKSDKNSTDKKTEVKNDTKKDDTKKEEIKEEEPEEEPKEEPEEEPEPEKKPYVVDTIVKANVDDYFQYTKDSNDNLYYNEDGIIYKVNTKSGSKKKVFDSADLVIDNDEMTLSDFEILSVCYDDNKNRILVTGEFKEINSANSVNNHLLCEIGEDGFEVIEDDFRIYYTNRLKKVLNNGDYVVLCRYIGSDSISFAEIVDSQSYTDNELFYKNAKQISTGIEYYNASIDNICDIYDDNSELYMIFEGVGMFHNSYIGVYSYDYTSDSAKLIFSNDADNCIGAISSNKIALAGEESFIDICNFKGKKLKKIDKDSIQINDRSKLDVKNIERTMYFTNNDDIIFYDTNAKAFRIIKENN